MLPLLRKSCHLFYTHLHRVSLSFVVISLVNAKYDEDIPDIKSHIIS